MNTPLSLRFREETSEAHDSAERSAFLTNLLEGRLSIHAWIALLEQYQPIYSALEDVASEFRAEGKPDALLSPHLDRGEAIAKDLTALRARTGNAPGPVYDVTAEYAERIRETRADFARYIAHHYTRYLGDLSGGQAMRVIIDRKYTLPDNEAAFAIFEHIEKIPAFKNAYRAGLDALVLTEEEAQGAVDEASYAFAANERMFAALAGDHKPAVITA